MVESIEVLRYLKFLKKGQHCIFKFHNKKLSLDLSGTMCTPGTIRITIHLMYLQNAYGEFENEINKHMYKVVIIS